TPYLIRRDADGCSNFFFFSSRRRHTRFSRDWSSDVCLPISRRPALPHRRRNRRGGLPAPGGPGRRGRPLEGDHAMTTTPRTRTARPSTPARALNTARTLATAGRVLRQLRHDPRTTALLLVLPCLM